MFRQNFGVASLSSVGSRHLFVQHYDAAGGAEDTRHVGLHQRHNGATQLLDLAFQSGTFCLHLSDNLAQFADDGWFDMFHSKRFGRDCSGTLCKVCRQKPLILTVQYQYAPRAYSRVTGTLPPRAP